MGGRSHEGEVVMHERQWEVRRVVKAGGGAILFPSLVEALLGYRPGGAVK